ncbi:prepilin peptidase [Cohnella fermenti]|uniref:Prepilin peptidase n=1 Tax=Cohnella fermenti TaxID=2565925 RepID=A0A4S4BRX5_9BACL|nr:A24 family peptidase [Cohnella fermenti]THF76941.1 prepilin peptidase [Cohnella fermenti]
MTILLSIYLFCLGAVLGSFYNVVALRVPVGESVVRPASRCGSCGRQLAARDLVPIVSLALSGGKCRHCGAKVSRLYSLGEAATGLLFVLMYLRFGLTLEALTGALLASVCVIVAVSDLKYMLIPNKVLLSFSPLLVAAILLAHSQPIWSHLLGAAVGGGGLLAVALLSREGMGLGDVKLFALLGWVVGLRYLLLAILVASLVGLLVGAARRGGRKQPIPFGPFLGLGALVAYGYGASIVDFYLSLFR